MSGVEIEEKSVSVPSHKSTHADNSVPVSVLTHTSHVGIAHPSLISFHVAPSNTAMCQSVLLAGQITSQLQVQLSPLGIPKLRIAS